MERAGSNLWLPARMETGAKSTPVEGVMERS